MCLISWTHPRGSETESKVEIFPNFANEKIRDIIGFVLNYVDIKFRDILFSVRFR
jgi:hypothetical protein